MITTTYRWKPIIVICGFLLLTSVQLVPLAPCSAVVAPPSSVAEKNTNQIAASAYQDGVSLLTRGRRLETAIEKISEAVRLASENEEYHLALGCALARRAVIICRASDAAITYETTKARYAARYAVWERAQTDRTNPLFEAVPPPQPISPTTMDDNKAFTLTQEQARECASDLCRRAFAEWDTAVTLTSGGTDTKRANTHYVRGWGMIVLKRIAKNKIDPKLVPEQKQILAEFEASLAIAPQNPRYWQSLGDAYISDSSPKLWQREEAIAAYQKALRLDGRSPTLWHLLYTLQAETDPDAAVTSLEKATAVDSSNAYYWYLLANLRLKKYAGKDEVEIHWKLSGQADKAAETTVEKPTHTRDLAALKAGLDAVERGNRGTFRPTAYQYAIPTLLAPLNPHNTVIKNSLFDIFIVLLPGNIGLAVKASIASGNTGFAIATAQTGVQFGERILELVQTQSSSDSEFLSWAFCTSAIHTTYSSLVEAQEGAGDTDGAAQSRVILAERDALVKRNVRRTEAILKQYYQ